MGKILFAEPTPSQSFRLVGRGEKGNLAKRLDATYQLQSEGRFEEACEARYEAFQEIMEAIDEGQASELDRTHPNTLAAMEIIKASAIDHYLWGDADTAAAQLEMLLDLDSEDPLEATPQLALCYVALGDWECLDDIDLDLDDRSPIKALANCCRNFALMGKFDEQAVAALRRHREFAEELASDTHPTDEAYLADIASEKPSRKALARELYLRAEPAIAAHKGLLAALKEQIG